MSDALEGAKVEGVVNVAGGWAGGNTQDKNWIKNADLMWKQSGGESNLTASVVDPVLWSRSNLDRLRLPAPASDNNIFVTQI